MNHRKLKEFLGAWGAAFAIGSVASFSGTRLAQLFPTFDALPLLFLLTGAFVLACAANRTAAKVFARNHFGMPPEERRAMTEALDRACREDSKAVLRRFGGMETTPVFMLIIYFMLVISMIVTGSFCTLSRETHASIPVARLIAALVSYMFGIVLLHMPLLRLFALIPHKLNQDALVSVQKLPVLHDLAQKAADTVGIKENIRLEITRECDCDVNRIGRTYVVFLGTRLMAVVDEDELFQCLLMAFEKFVCPKLNRQILRRYRLGMLGAADVRRETFAFDLFFSYADAYMEWEYDLYLRAVRKYLEQCAYERVRQDGNTRAAVQALAKKAMWNCFVFEYIHFNSTPFYKEPAPPTHLEEQICREFRQACGKRSQAWVDMLAQELRSPSDDLPLFREERALLEPDGESLSDIVCPTVDGTAYGNDVMVAIREEVDRRIAPEIARTYEKEREREYLEPLRTVEEYEASPDGYSTPELSPVINAYRELGRFAKAEALCDSILETETNPFAMAHAIYFKGMCMLHRYETEGIDYIYRAIDLNKNYMKDGFELVEDYCLRCGLTDEYESFRRRAEIQMSAHAYNQEGAGYLVATDHLEPEEELGDMLPDILSYMEQVSDGCLRQVYLVRKVVSEDFFTSAFVVNFEYGISEEQMRKIYVAIFNYLDAYPVDWQFSLFIYDRETERAVRQVEGSLVWEKK